MPKRVSYDCAAGVAGSPLTDLDALNLEELDLRIVPNGRLHVAQIDDTPDVGAEPCRCARIGLVLSDENGMRHWEQSH